MNTSWHPFPAQLDKLRDETEHLLPSSSPSRAKILNHITNKHLENAFSDPLKPSAQNTIATTLHVPRHHQEELSSCSQ